MTLLRLILRRLVFGAGTLLLVSVLVFTGTELLPGDVAEAALGQPDEKDRQPCHAPPPKVHRHTIAEIGVF